MENDRMKSERLKKRFKRSQKALVLLMLLLTVSQVVSLGLLAVCERRPLEQVRLELLGLEYLKPLHRLQDLLPLYPGKVAAAAKGGDAERESLLLYEQEIDSALDRLEKIDRRHGTKLDTTEDLVHLLDLWRQLRARDRQERRDPPYRHFEEGVRSMIGLVGDTSDLILDPEIETYYLIDSLVNRLVQGAEMLNAIGGLQPPDGGVADPGEAAFLSRALQRNLQETSRNYHVSLEDDETTRSRLEKPLRSYEAKIVSLIRLLGERPGPDGRAPGNLSKLVENALAANSRLFVRTLPEVRRLLEARRQELEGRRTHRIAWVLPFLLIGLGLGTWGLRSETRPAEAHEHSAPLERTAPPLEEGVSQENEALKLLVAELALANRSLRQQVSNPTP